MSKKYKMYGSEFSLYSGKVRSYLRKKGIRFKEVNSSLRVYKKFIVPRTGVQYIPVVQTPDNQVLQDTSVIIDELEKRFPENPVYPQTPLQKLVALLLEVYADEWLLIPAMHYRWYYKEDNYQVITAQFGKMLKPLWPGFLQRMVGRKVATKFQGAVSLLGVHEHNIEAVEWSYLQTLNELQVHFTEHDYLLGGKPSIADFGFIGPFYAHLYRDPYPGKMLREVAPAVVQWVERMLSTSVMQGDFLEHDEIPVTLYPILKRMASEQLPVLLDTDTRLADWKKANPDTTIPRHIGKHTFTIENVDAERMIFPYSLWMFQRPRDYYQSLSFDQREHADALLQMLGFGDALNRQGKTQLIRQNNKLVFAEL